MLANEQALKCDQPEYCTISIFIDIQVLDVGGIKETPWNKNVHLSTRTGPRHILYVHKEVS